MFAYHNYDYKFLLPCAKYLSLTTLKNILIASLMNVWDIMNKIVFTVQTFLPTLLSLNLQTWQCFAFTTTCCRGILVFRRDIMTCNLIHNLFSCRHSNAFRLYFHGPTSMVHCCSFKGDDVHSNSFNADSLD